MRLNTGISQLLVFRIIGINKRTVPVLKTVAISPSRVDVFDGIDVEFANLEGLPYSQGNKFQGGLHIRKRNRKIGRELLFFKDGL